MKRYTDYALTIIQENTAKLYAKLAGTNPTDNLTQDDILDLMYYIKAFQNAAHTEETRRKIETLKARRK